MKLIFSLLTSLVLISCGSTKITKKKELPPLASDAKVDVYSKTPPLFDYDVICEAEVTSKGNFTSTNMSGYTSKAKSIARQCGAKMAVIKSLHGFSSGSGANVTVQIEAGIQTSEESKLYKQDEMLKKLSSAVTVGNLKNTSLILKKLKMNPIRKKRSSLDEVYLSFIMRLAAEKGKNCPLKTMSFLNKKYDVSIGHFEDHSSGGRYATTYHVALQKILECPSSSVSQSFSKLKNKDASITALNNTVTKAVNGGYASKTLRKNFVLMYPQIQKIVQKSCQKDSLSSTCSLKTNLSKLYKASKR